MSTDKRYEQAQDFLKQGHSHQETSRLLGVSETELYFILNTGSLNSMFKKEPKTETPQNHQPRMTIITNLHTLVTKKEK